MTGEPLAPQRTRRAVPRRGDPVQLRTARLGAQRPHHAPRYLHLLLHPLHSHRRVPVGQPQRAGEVRALQLAGLLQPPQGQQFPVVRVEPARRLGDLTALLGQPQPQDGQPGEVQGRIGDRLRVVQMRPAVPVRGPRLLPVPYLPDRDRHQPGPERGRIPQLRQPAHHAQQRLLYDVVDVGVTVQGAADDVVDQRQATAHQVLQGPSVTRPGGRDQAGVGPPPMVLDHVGLFLHAGIRLSERRPPEAHGDNRKTADRRRNPFRLRNSCCTDPVHGVSERKAHIRHGPRKAQGWHEDAGDTVRGHREAPAGGTPRWRPSSRSRPY